MGVCARFQFPYASNELVDTFVFTLLDDVIAKQFFSSGAPPFVSHVVPASSYFVPVVPSQDSVGAILPCGDIDHEVSGFD
jgi:hypothetical protein|tara:strand:+ start:239 stop:478 length:240 start_codon:yes stop_codon:yes gene_type:complete